MGSSWLEETKEVFFLGARSGWASGNDGQLLSSKEGSPGMEDWRYTVWHDPIGFQGYCYTDRWGRDPDSGKPSGQIVITHWSIPVWVMWYGGNSYPKETLPFLRDMLMDSYRSDRFVGGRGPVEYFGEFAYLNDFTGDFDRFTGTECIAKRITHDRLGSHSYWGGSLVFLKKS